MSRDAFPTGTASRDVSPKPASHDASPKPPPRSKTRSLRTSRMRPPAPHVAIEARLIGDPDRLIADTQAVPAALDGPPPERHLWRLDQPGAQQHPITGHADDVAFEAAKISEKDFDRLLLALRPALGDPLVPIRHFLLGARHHAVGRAARRRPGAHQIETPVRGRRGELRFARDL